MPKSGSHIFCWFCVKEFCRCRYYFQGLTYLQVTLCVICCSISAVYVCTSFVDARTAVCQDFRSFVCQQTHLGAPKLCSSATCLLSVILWRARSPLVTSLSLPAVSCLLRCGGHFQSDDDWSVAVRYLWIDNSVISFWNLYFKSRCSTWCVNHLSWEHSWKLFKMLV